MHIRVLNSVPIKINFFSTAGERFFEPKKSNLESNFRKKNPKKLYCRHPFKKAKRFSFPEINPTVSIKHKPTKSKVSYSSDFIFKTTFKPNKSQKNLNFKTRLQSNGENPLK